MNIRVRRRDFQYEPSKFLSKEQLQASLERYKRVKDEASRTGDWSKFADMFTETGFVIEHAYGKFQGREEIRRYITNVMKPYPNMTFPFTWEAVDQAHNAVIFEVWNDFPTPPLESGEPYGFPNITRLVFDPNVPSPDGKAFQICEEQDWYNPMLYAGSTVKDWKQAGGTFQSKEMLRMHHDQKRNNHQSKL